jgi:signal transduction histidine kinase
MVNRLRLLVCSTALLASIGTLLVVFLPGLKFAYWDPGIDAGIETAAAVVAILAAYLIGRRFGRTRELRDLVLVGALWVLVVTHVAFSTLPALFGNSEAPFLAWALIVTRLLGASIFTIAAFMPDVRVGRTRRASLLTVAALGSALVLITLVVAAIDPPRVLDHSPTAADTAYIEGFDVVGAIQLVVAVLLGIAAAGFAALGIRRRDELIGWFAIGMTLSAFSRLNYVLFPSLSPQWVFTGDILRFAFYVVLLIGALRELGIHQRDVANAAALGERQRLARELHDGLAQELAFLAKESHRLAERSREEAATHLAEAADRALSESRQAIALLAVAPEQPLDAMISQTARELTSRASVELRLDLDPRADLPPADRQALVRIVREAVWNGLRHGRASMIAVELAFEPELRLRVRDNGVGFDTSRPESWTAGFGLIGIEERARALGGEARFSSRPGKGTEVEVCLP